MNFYNPYLYSIPTTTASTGLLSRLNFSSILSGTTKALNFVNQAIPVVKQVSPIMKNAKTMFQIMNEFKKTDTTSAPIDNNTSLNNSHDSLPEIPVTTNGPTFFV